VVGDTRGIRYDNELTNPKAKAMIDIKPGVFLRYDPLAAPAPLLVDVSRSGREYPHDFRSPLPFTEVHDNVSMYVEDLCAAAPGLGATLLYACFPNTYIDTNRSAMDIDESMIEGKWPGPITQSDFTERGLGLLKRLSRYGTQMQERKLTVAEVQARLADYHEPYHQELTRVLAQLKQRFGATWQLSFHCMSAIGAPTHADPGKERSDFCIGDVKGATCKPEFLQFIADTLKGLGHTVSVNFPYYGGYLTKRHSDPANGMQSVFIEINKRLFIDTKTFRKTAGFGPTKSSVEALIAKTVDYARATAKPA
jgi:N-formylglutamate amidohydrolase